MLILLKVLIRSVSTTISGDESKQDIELFDHLDKIRTKIRIKDLKPEDLDKLEQKKPRRAKSAELNRQKKLSSKRNRSISADLKKKKTSTNAERINGPNESSSTVSILKTSASPRTRRDMMKKHVKFEKNLSQSKNSEEKKPVQSKIEMNMNWLMTINYSKNSQISNLRTLENFDKSIKAIDKRLIGIYESKVSKSTQSVEQLTSAHKNSENVSDNLIHVFECNQWLDGSGEDRKTDRILKLSNVLSN